MFYISLTDQTTGMGSEAYYDFYVAEDKIKCTFEDGIVPELSNIRLEILDNAMNVSSYFLGGFGGKIGAHLSEISTDEKSYSITFEFTGDYEFSGASLILAFYDDKGSVMHTDIMKNQSASTGEYVFTGNFDASTADKCKLFIWRDTESFEPLDTAKIFDIKMYEISRKTQLNK